MELKRKTAVVTGAGGFIGSAVCRRLAEEGCEVVGLDVDPALASRVEATGARFELADVTDRPALDRALSGADLVVHTAAYVREWGEMEDFIRVNVGGTVNVLDAAEEAGAERVVHLSSVVVYGYADETEQDESAYRRNVGVPYIDTKSASDRIAMRRGAVIIRPGDVYGPASVPWLLRPLELTQSGQAALPGKGDGQMLPVYIDDLVDSIVLAAQKGKPGTAYAVWSGEDVTFDDFFERLAQISGGSGARHLPRPVMSAAAGAVEGAFKLLRKPPRFGRHGVTLIDRRGTVSNELAREELGWEPQVRFDEGMRRSEEWLRAEGLV